MRLLDFFKKQHKKAQGSALVAKERLQILVAHERRTQGGPDYLPHLQKDILEVVSKYVKIDADQVQVSVDNDNDCSILELNVTLPE